MKTINTNKPKSSITNKAIFGALVAFALIFAPVHIAKAGTDAGFSDYSGGYGIDYDYGSSGYGVDYDYGNSGYGIDYDYGSSGYGVDYDYGTPSYSYPSYDTGSYSTPYSYGGGYSSPVYSYIPQASYQYIPTGSGGGAQYVSSSNTNLNSNDNTNNNVITNTFNPTNNNDARINLIVYGGGTGTNTNTEQSLDGNCTINPTVANINQDVSFYVTATGGVSGYSYSWTGTDGIYSSAQSFTGRYSYPGYKTATVTIRSGSQTITRTCSVNVQAYNTVLNTQSNVTVLRDQNNLGTPVSGVFLSQVPETGIGFGLKLTLFTLGLTLWSIFAAFMIARKKNGVALSKINAFKLANMQKKGIQA